MIQEYPTHNIHSFYSHSYHMYSEQAINLSQNINRTPPSSQQIEHYLDEPNLAQYLCNPERVNDDYALLNRNMARINKKYLPKLIYYYQTILLNYQIYQAQFLPPQQRGKKWQIKMKQNGAQITKDLSTGHTGCVLVGQTIVFTKIDFNTFKGMFYSSSHSQILKGIESTKRKREKSLVSRRQGQSLIEVLFKLFCLPSFDFILWPSLFLQPVLGNKQTIYSIINPKAKEITSSETQRILFQNTLNSFFQNFINSKRPSSFFEPSPQQQIFLNSIKGKVQESRSRQQFITKLIGANTTLIQKNLFIRWNDFSKDQLLLLISQTPFRLLTPQINSIINKLNDYRKHQQCPFTGKDSLFHLGKLKHKQQQQICIPIRYAKNSVLVRCLTPTDHYEWVKQKQLTVNRAMPQHNLDQRKFYGIFGKSFDVYEVFSFIYSQYFYQDFQYIQALRIMNPHNQLERHAFKEERCLACHYLIRKQQEYFYCKICQIKYHSQCTGQKPKQYCKTIHLADHDQSVWTCAKCRPCKICYQSMNELSPLTCKQCKQIYHAECGKLIDINGQSVQMDGFVCSSCLKCEFCLRNLTNEQFYYQNEKVLCSLCLASCYKEFCLVCRDFIQTKHLVICNNPLCKQTFHRKCDSLLAIYPKLSGQFKCRRCRVSEKRKILKWVVEELRIFDEYEYFDDPYYQSIEGYSDVIKEPMCFFVMRSKISRGEYDEYSYQNMLKDLHLIANNAMKFNMPKEQVHYQAKILLIIGSHFLNKFQTLLNFNDFQILSKDLRSVFLSHRAIFYKDMFKNFTHYVLNYGKQEARIKVMGYRESPTNQYIFSSRHLLIKGLINSQITYQYRLHPHHIQQIFNMPRLIPALWSKVAYNICYYHPKQKLPIVFQCKICWETYCCTKVCYKHYYCQICKKQGCYCIRRACKCPPLSKLQYSILRRQAMRALSKTQLTLLQYTEYHKYCLKCVKQLNRSCYLCQQICYFGYQTCGQCSALYHITCEKKNRMKDVAQLYQGICDSNSLYHQIILNNKCKACSISPHNLQRYKKLLKECIQQVSRKRTELMQYTQLFSYIYSENGVRLTTNQIINILYQNYEHLQSKVYFIRQFTSLFHKQHQVQKDSVPQQLQVEGQLQTFTDNYQTQIQGGSIQYTHYLRQMEVRQRLSNICKTAICLSPRLSFHFALEIPSFSIEFTTLAVGNPFNQIMQRMKENVIQFHGWRQPLRINYKSLYEFQSYTTTKNKHSNFYIQSTQQQQFFQQQIQELLQYLRFKDSHSSQQRISLISDPLFTPLYDWSQHKVLHPVRENLAITPFYQALTHKQDILYKYLTTFALRMFQDQKRVLRKGNTYILHEGQFNWKICKKINSSYCYIHLFKDHNANWILAINQHRRQVKELNQIYNALKEFGANVNTFEDLYSFMGFSLMNPTHKNADHFTNLLKRKEFLQTNEESRKEQVMKVYNQFEWNNKGAIRNKGTRKEYRVKAKKPFYLAKRNSPTEQQEEKEKYLEPLITLQDIKKQLFLGGSSHSHQPEPNISIIPLNDVYIGPSKIDRLGLFIGQAAPKYTTIIEYVGEIISQTVADIRERRYTDGCYFFTLGEGDNSRIQIIDATRFGNKARYLNHSCDPNCKAQIKKVEGRNKIFFYTIKDVQQSEQLTYDYQFKIDSKEHLVCKCGSTMCQGRLN